MLHDEIDLTVLSPGSIVALWRNVRRAQIRNDRAVRERGAARDEELDGLTDTLPSTMDDFIRDHFPQARSVVLAFVESPLAEDRQNIVTHIPLAAIEDHDFGLELWGRLARDPSPAVRYDIVHELTIALDDPDPDFAIRRDLGITAQEGHSLIHAAEKVASGDLPPYDLGRVVLAQVVGHEGNGPATPDPVH